MNEFELIAHLTEGLATRPDVLTGPGDDCAVLRMPDGRGPLLFKTDAVVEGVHFTTDTPPEKIGHKALARCLSDIAAMGGRPAHAVVTLAAPRQHDAERLSAIYRGINALANRHGVAIVGGETTSNPGGLLISIALLGTVPTGRAILRSGAKPGDALFVTGELGGSLQGRHLEFEPRVVEGAWLAERFEIHAMIDLSDGLAGDLRHILKQSGCGAEVLAKSLPISRAARLAARNESSAMPPLLAALTDGEDFELLFTVAAADAVALLDSWKTGFPKLKLTCIGKITAQPGLRIRTEDGGVRDMSEHGYAHFQES
ncbi:MAG TPA: thiamine-monophosphate kinase [Verrucomicrobiales bacterium]|nr:thiamine-monophosphate kinase [Verrucomicrobiales bacterium]